MSGTAPRKPAASAAPDDIGPDVGPPTRDRPGAGGFPSEPFAAPDARSGQIDRRSDTEIVARISAAVHEPFAEAWGRYEEEVWHPVRQTLEDAASAHELALGALAVEGMEDASPGGDREREGVAGDGGRRARAGDSGQAASGTPARYRDAVSEDVIEPLRAALAGRAVATELEESLASTVDRARIGDGAAGHAAGAGFPPARRARFRCRCHSHDQASRGACTRADHVAAGPDAPRPCGPAGPPAPRSGGAPQPGERLPPEPARPGRMARAPGARMGRVGGRGAAAGPFDR